MVKTLVGAVIAAMATGAVAMASRISSNVNTHEARISVLEDHTKGIDKKLDSMDRKLDMLLARRR
jgi:peptidoglycan hydrolase CwlO-like protein